MRDNFSITTLRTLRDRVAGLCSRCGRLTVGPADDLGVMIVGEGAHITAAAPDGPRYDATLTQEQRMDLANGIWLCRTCHGIIDRNDTAYPADLLRNWKAEAEARAGQIVNSVAGQLVPDELFLELRWREVRSRAHLRFVSITDVDAESVTEVLGATGTVEIEYAKRIEQALEELRQRDRDPDAHAAGNPHRPNMEERQRADFAAYLNARNKQLLKRASLMAEHNAAALNRLLAILNELGASADESRLSVTTFAKLAALRLVLVLKQGFDWNEQGNVPWFESFQLETTAGPTLFPLVPKDSQTGIATFGYRYWCAARVGSEKAYEYVMFPLREVLPIFRSGLQGDRQSFFIWVLPQLLDSDRIALKPAEGNIALEDWQAFLLLGSDVEWWSAHQRCPWSEVIGRLNLIDRHIPPGLLVSDRSG